MKVCPLPSHALFIVYLRPHYACTVPSFPVRGDFNLKQHQVRQKPATLPTPSDVYFKLARRYPELCTVLSFALHIPYPITNIHIVFICFYFY